MAIGYIPTMGEYPQEKLKLSHILILFWLNQYPKCSTDTLCNQVVSGGMMITEAIIQKLMFLTLITLSDDTEEGAAPSQHKWELTERGLVYLANLADMPLPVPRIMWCTDKELQRITKEAKDGNL